MRRVPERPRRGDRSIDPPRVRKLPYEAARRRRDANLVAVQEEHRARKNEARARVELETRARRAPLELGARERPRRRREEDVRLGLRKKAAGECADVAVAPADIAHRFGRVAHPARRDRARMARGFLARIAIVPRGSEAVAQEIQKSLHEFLVGRSAESDGPCEALGFGNTMMRNARWKVEHVARLEHPLGLGLEAREDLEVQARHEGEILLARDLPPAPAASLQEEHVVGIHVRPHAAAGHRVAHHDVVDARMGNEVEPRQKLARLARKVVRILDQHGPIPAWKLLECAMRGSGHARRTSACRAGSRGASSPLRSTRVPAPRAARADRRSAEKHHAAARACVASSCA